MRRQFVALTAVACLATAGCTTTDPAGTPTPTDVATTVVESTETTEATASGTPESQPSAVETETPKAPTTESGDAGTTEEAVDLADHAFAIAPQQAIDKGLEKSGDGIVHSIELDWSRYHNAWVYELDILVGNIDNEIDVHADTGAILEHEQDDTDDKELAINLQTPMSWETARDKALGAVQGRITSWKLEWDNDYSSYEFDIEDSTGDETEVEVNVDTGEVRIDD